MKKYRYWVMAFMSGFLVALTLEGQAQYHYVTVVPAPTVIVRPAPPSPRHVWIGSEWAWRGGRYVEVRPYWGLPPRGYHLWVPGHWVRSRRGNYWVNGYWRR